MTDESEQPADSPWWIERAHWYGRPRAGATDRIVPGVDQRDVSIDVNAIPLCQIADELQDGVIAVDERNQIVFANSAFERLLGYQPGTTLGRSVDELFLDYWTSNLLPGAGSARYGGRVGSQTTPSGMRGRARCRNGSSIPVSIVRPAIGATSSLYQLAMIRDVRNESEELTRARLAAIVDVSKDAIYSKSLNGTILSWNLGAERLYGYLTEEAIGQSVSMLIPPERDGEMDIILARLASGAQIEQYETSRVRKDGKTVWISLSAAPTRNAEGTIIGASMIARDVTAQRKAKAALRESEERLRAVVESAGEGIVLQDAHNRTLLTNPSADRILGLNPDGTSGAAAVDWRWNALREDGTPLPWEEHPIAVTLRTGLPLSDVVIGVPAPGSAGRDGRAWKWLSINTGPVIATGAPAPHAVVVSFFDITELRRTRSELTKQYDEIDRRQHQMAAILDAAQEAMVLVSPDGSVGKANRGFYDLLSLSQDDQARVVASPLNALSREFQERFGQNVLQTLISSLDLSGDDSATGALRQIWPEPHDFDVTVTAVRGHEGGDLGRLYSFRDVTHEREIERLKNDFVATVSHELRTPLTAISGFVDLMVEGFAGDLPPRVRHYLTIVQNNNRRLGKIIDDLLDISRIEAGVIDLSCNSIDVAATIQTIAASFEPQLMSKQQSLRLDLGSALPRVWADAARVAQVLTNLLSNAHKYTPEGGAITISTRVEETELRIEVIDTGIGLTVSEQEQLFTKFFRSANPMARKANGTGLGLAITKSLVELHRGTLSVVSAPGQGSIFAFTLPYLPPGGEMLRERGEQASAAFVSPLPPMPGLIVPTETVLDLNRSDAGMDLVVDEGFRDPTTVADETPRIVPVVSPQSPIASPNDVI